MKVRYFVKPIVCDNEVFDTQTNESVVICNSHANAIIIADILNFENERPNNAESWLADHDKEVRKEVRKQVCDEIREYLKQMIPLKARHSPPQLETYRNGWLGALETIDMVLDQIEKKDRNYETK